MLRDVARSGRERVPSTGSFSGECVVFTGRLSCLSRDEAEALVRRLGGGIARDVTDKATLLVVGEGASRGGRLQSRKLASARSRSRPGLRVLSEREFCERAGIPSDAELGTRYHPLRAIRARFPELRDDRIRYLESWGLVRPAQVTHSERYYTFDALALLSAVHERLRAGAPLRAIVQDMVAERHGQLSLELRQKTPGATVIPLRPASSTAEAEEWFQRGAQLEGEAGSEEAAAEAYARALELDPGLVAALINLANLYYLRDEPEYARRLYRRAEQLASEEFFQIPFNLANIAHDRGEYGLARRLYERALRLAPDYPDAHLYLALTLEKLGFSREAGPHWRAYRLLEPAGEWVALAREMERAD